VAVASSLEEEEDPAGAVVVAHRPKGDTSREPAPPLRERRPKRLGVLMALLRRRSSSSAPQDGRSERDEGKEGADQEPRK